jgi:hypothetical protein
MRQRGGLNDLVLLCAIVLLIASGALAVGVFLYQQFLQTESASKVAQLKRAEAAFEPALVTQITRLDDRMHAADSILSTHLAPTAFFQMLQQSTLQTVSFRSLDLQAPDPQHITLKMQGLARSVNSIALQADLFSKSNVITSPIFSNIARQSDGVHFDLSAVVNPTALNFSGVAGQSVSQGAPQTQQQSQTSATPLSPFNNAPASPDATPPSTGTSDGN